MAWISRSVKLGAASSRVRGTKSKSTPGKHDRCDKSQRRNARHVRPTHHPSLSLFLCSSLSLSLCLSVCLSQTLVDMHKLQCCSKLASCTVTEIQDIVQRNLVRHGRVAAVGLRTYRGTHGIRWPIIFSEAVYVIVRLRHQRIGC